MARSPHYARIRLQVLDVVERVPPGRVTTYAEIADELAVVPRHVAYLLATLAPDERAELPWHRVVGADGALAGGERGAEQRARLAEEGVVVGARGRVDLAEHGVRLLLDEQHRASSGTPLERSPQ